MATQVLDTAALEQLDAVMKGPVITPDRHGYDEARKVFNAAIDRRPGVIVQCLDPHDVIACIEASEEKLHSPRRHLVEFRQRRIEMVPDVTAYGVGHRLRHVSGGVVEARGVDGEKIGHGRKGQVDR